MASIRPIRLPPRSVLRFAVDAGAAAMSWPRHQRGDDFDGRSEAQARGWRSDAHTAPRQDRLVHARVGSESFKLLGIPRFGGRGSAHNHVPALGNLCSDKVAEFLPHGR